ncbi:MAG TPA: hypothetical protein EYQ20_19155 [candidate division Zixibacteria bacterium]|nr:hypothetical protein [candidate division Zixibacteria bacterium]
MVFYRAEEANHLNKPVKPPSDPSAKSPGPRLMGTPQYMSPEQAEAETLDHSRDIFSFGVVMYEASTGKKACDGMSRTSLMGRSVNEDPEPVTSIKPITPYPLWQVVRQSLRKSREDRTQAALELFTDLCEVQGEVQAGTVLVDGNTIPPPMEPDPIAPEAPAFWRQHLLPDGETIVIFMTTVEDTGTLFAGRQAYRTGAA